MIILQRLMCFHTALGIFHNTLNTLVLKQLLHQNKSIVCIGRKNRVKFKALNNLGEADFKALHYRQVKSGNLI